MGGAGFNGLTKQQDLPEVIPEAGQAHFRTREPQKAIMAVDLEQPRGKLAGRARSREPCEKGLIETER
jgi:hypothetical protein